MSTPASPTPYVDAGEELMLVLRDFLSASLSFNQKNANPNDHLYLQSIERNTDSALKLLKEMPVAKEAVFEYFSFVIDLLVTQEFAEVISIFNVLFDSASHWLARCLFDKQLTKSKIFIISFAEKPGEKFDFVARKALQESLGPDQASKVRLGLVTHFSPLASGCSRRSFIQRQSVQKPTK